MSIDCFNNHILSGETMGTRYSVNFYAADGLDIKRLAEVLFAAVDNVDMQMSTWKPDSDLMKINDAPLNVWLPLKPELALVLDCAFQVSTASQGAFDVGVGAIVNAWGFGAGCREPNVEDIKQQLNTNRSLAVHCLELNVKQQKIRKIKPCLIDLSGIAKGFAVDEMIRVLKEFGIENALASLDGELMAIGTEVDGRLWNVALEMPDFEKRSAMGMIALDNCGVATSGDYRHWVDVGDEKLSHSMNPKTGGPVQNNTASVTVVAKSCMYADAWATALMVMGKVDGIEFSRLHGLNTLFIVRKHDELIQIACGDVFNPTAHNVCN